jgi:signal peptidase I
MSDFTDPDARRLHDERDDGASETEPETPWDPEGPKPWEPEPERPWEPEPGRPWEPEPERPWEPEPEPEPERPWEPEPAEPWEPTSEHARDLGPPPAWEQRPEVRHAPPPWRDTPAEPPPWDAAPPPPAPPPEPPRKGLNPLVRLGIPQPWRTIIDWIVTIVGAIVIVLAIKAYIVNPYRIPSSSMEPTLHCARPGSLCTARFSDRVLACRFCYWFHGPHRGDIVVFNVPSKAEQVCGAGGVFVKRVVGLPGDVWREKDGFVYINGKRLDEPYIKPERRDFQSYPAQKIPKDSYFMMGDNRQSSCDSRRWGVVPRKNIIGKVFAIYWPPNRIRVV